MELTEAIYHRRAVRHYTGAKVSDSIIQQLIDAAVQAPSSLNDQPWVFAVFQGKERLKDYSDRAKAHFLATELPAFGCHERADTLTEPTFNLFYEAGTVIVIYAKPGKSHSSSDCYLAAQTLMLAAFGASLGTCPIGLARPWFDLAKVKNELEIPSDLTAVFVLTLGYPTEASKLGSRKVPEIVSWKRAVEPVFS